MLNSTDVAALLLTSPTDYHNFCFAGSVPGPTFEFTAARPAQLSHPGGSRVAGWSVAHPDDDVR